MADTATPAGDRPVPSPLDAWDLPAGTAPLVLSTGRVVEIESGSLTAEILSGLLPEQILNFDVFRYLGEGAEVLTPQARIKRIYEAKLMRVARGLRTPRLALGPVHDLLNVIPDRANGEIGPRQLRPAEIDEIYDALIKGVLPDVATAPFQGQGAGDGGVGADPSAGNGLPTAAEPVPAAAE